MSQKCKPYKSRTHLEWTQRLLSVFFIVGLYCISGSTPLSYTQEAYHPFVSNNISSSENQWYTSINFDSSESKSTVESFWNDVYNFGFSIPKNTSTKVIEELSGIKIIVTQGWWNSSRVVVFFQKNSQEKTVQKNTDIHE